MEQEQTTALAERMLREGRISPALASAALERHKNLGERFEEALLECGLPESVLLRHLAEMFRTKFISTKTLASSPSPHQAMMRLPRRLAEDLQVVPIRFSSEELLTVVSADPGDADLMERVRVSAGAAGVTGLVARPAAVRAAIAKHYGGDANAFDGLYDSDGPSSPTSQLPGADGESLEASSSAALPPPASAARGSSGSIPAIPPPPAPPGPPPSMRGGSMPASEPSPTQLGGDLPPPKRAKPALPPPPGGPPSAAPPRSAPPASSIPPPPAGSRNTLDEARAQALGSPSGVAEALVIIAERNRGSLKGHSVRVARLAHALCVELDLSPSQAAHAWASGLYHDLGKAQTHHLTPLNVWQLRDHETAARAQYSNPSRVLKNAAVPPTVATAVLHMYERYDGRGFPDGLQGERVPYQSRVLALCDSVMDLTLNPNNTLGRIVSPLEACSHIKAQTPRVFDPTLVAHFSRLVVEGRLDDAFLSERSAQGIEKLLA